MIDLCYVDGDSRKLFFNKDDLVFRSIDSFDVDTKGALRFEYEIFGLRPIGQCKDNLEKVKKLNHPTDCVLDINATFNLLRYRLVNKSLISNLREERDEKNQQNIRKRNHR